jgi:hypothetical protein
MRPVWDTLVAGKWWKPFCSRFWISHFGDMLDLMDWNRNLLHQSLDPETDRVTDLADFLGLGQGA